MSGVKDFDFLLGSWNILNRRRTTPFSPKKDGVWEEFSAHSTSAKQLDGRARVEQYEATFPNGQLVLGLTIRAFDEATQQWSIVWLDNASHQILLLYCENLRMELASSIRLSPRHWMESWYMCALFGIILLRTKRAGNKPSRSMRAKPGIPTGLWNIEDRRNSSFCGVMVRFSGRRPPNPPIPPHILCSTAGTQAFQANRPE